VLTSWSLAAALLLNGLTASGAPVNDTPPALHGATTVAAADVAQAQASGATVIDVRTAAEYQAGHIKGAVNLPHRERAFAHLPVEKTAAIVIYGNGTDSWTGFRASSAAIGSGYTNVLWYRLGFPDWKANGRSVE
jgi:rhodanese-related sulfurtransferase